MLVYQRVTIQLLGISHFWNPHGISDAPGQTGLLEVLRAQGPGKGRAFQLFNEDLGSGPSHPHGDSRRVLSLVFLHMKLYTYVGHVWDMCICT